MNILFQKNFQRVFGTFPLRGEDLNTAVQHAVKAGYRAFDTAQMYGNEADLGAALAQTGLAREDLCFVTKVHPHNYTESAFLPSVEQSLRDLRIEAADVLLLHWPPEGGQIAAPVKMLAQAHAQGLARNIGVSNFTAAMMREAKALIAPPIVANQVEFHPLLDQSVLLAAAAETGIPLMAYCSVARGEVLRYPELAEIGAGYGKTAAQVVLRWILQKGVIANAMSTNPTNIAMNYEVMDFTLSSVDMARIDALGATGYRIVTKNIVPWAPDWD